MSTKSVLQPEIDRVSSAVREVRDDCREAIFRRRFRAEAVVQTPPARFHRRGVMINP